MLESDMAGVHRVDGEVALHIGGATGGQLHAGIPRPAVARPLRQTQGAVVAQQLGGVRVGQDLQRLPEVIPRAVGDHNQVHVDVLRFHGAGRHLGLWIPGQVWVSYQARAGGARQDKCSPTQVVHLQAHADIPSFVSCSAAGAGAPAAGLCVRCLL